jgi:hypothetical protein
MDAPDAASALSWCLPGRFSLEDGTEACPSVHPPRPPPPAHAKHRQVMIGRAPFCARGLHTATYVASG